MDPESGGPEDIPLPPVSSEEGRRFDPGEPIRSFPEISEDPTMGSPGLGQPRPLQQPPTQAQPQPLGSNFPPEGAGTPPAHFGAPMGEAPGAGLKSLLGISVTLNVIFIMILTVVAWRVKPVYERYKRFIQNAETVDRMSRDENSRILQEPGRFTGSQGSGLPIGAQPGGVGFMESLSRIGSLPGAKGKGGDTAAQLVGIFSRYAKRPVIKNFMADFNSSPELIAAWQKFQLERDPSGLRGMFMTSRSFQSLIMKYSRNPEFIKVLTELSSSPEMQRLSQDVLGAGALGMFQPNSIKVGKGSTVNPYLLQGTKRSRDSRRTRRPPGLEGSKSR